MSKVNTQHLAQLIERIGGKDNITALLLGVEPLEVHHG